MAELTFYTNPMSRGRIARWMLEEVGAPYDTVIVPWDDKPAALLAANPMGKVPTIVHGDRVVSEAAAVCLYLADAFPEAGLAPDPADRAEYYRWILFAAGPVDQLMTHAALKVTPTAEQEGMVGYGNAERAVGALEAGLAGAPFVCGERFTAADVYVGSAIGWGMQFGAVPKTPGLSAYLERVNARPAAVRARAIDDALIAK